MAENLKEIFWRLIVTIIFGVLLGNILLLLVFLLPIERISLNAGQAADVFESESMDAVVKFHLFKTKLDNYTDAVMLSSAAYEGEESIPDKIVHVYHKEFEGKNPFVSFLLYCKGTQGSKSVEYSRYWHGYLVFLKLVLSVFNYTQIRILNMVIQTLLVLSALILMWKRNLKCYIVPFMLTLCFLDPVTIPYSLQFSTLFYIFMAATILIIWKYELLCVNNRFYVVFCCIGMLTSYMDFLTYPIAALGIPICIFCILENHNNKNVRIKKIILISVAWGIGYIGMWTGKWFSGSVLLRENLFSGAFAAIGERAGYIQDTETISYFSVLRRNLSVYLNIKGILLAVLSVFSCFICGHGNKKMPGKKDWIRVLPFILIGFMPFVWYLGTINHSYIHFWFTFRGLAVSAFAGQCALINLLSENGVYRKNHK